MDTDARMSTPLPVNRLLGSRYLLGRVIGRGGIATVCAATDTLLGRPVAVKVFSRNADELTMARLRAEARLLAGLSHPGLLRMFDFSEDEGRPFLVMQLINGVSLYERLHRGPVASGEAAAIGSQLA